MADELFETLVNVKPNQLPEVYFRTYFLPLFCGEIASENEGPAISNWIGIAGSLSSPVDIIAPDGSVMFQVPPFSDTTAIDNISKIMGKSNFSRFMVDNMRTRESLPRAAAVDLHNELGVRASLVTTREDRVNGYREKWAIIFSHYGKTVPGMGITSAPVNAVVEKSNGIPDDEIEYD